MFADAYISSLGYLWSFFVFREISLFHVRSLPPPFFSFQESGKRTPFFPRETQTEINIEGMIRKLDIEKSAISFVTKTTR